MAFELNHGEAYGSFDLLRHPLAGIYARFTDGRISEPQLHTHILRELFGIDPFKPGAADSDYLAGAQSLASYFARLMLMAADKKQESEADPLQQYPVFA